MNKTLLTVFLVVVAAFLFVGNADAAVSGECSDCHTMHASQNGVTSTANEVLLNDTCIGCHSGAGTEPKIDTTTGGTFPAGSFVDASSATETHNVSDLGSGFTIATAVDNTQTKSMTPPGWGGADWSVQLKCAGADGCHGSHLATQTTSFQGIAGSHHGGTDGYRFLRIAADNSGAGSAVDGIGSTSYNELTTDHNIYVAGSTGISEFCKNCHKLFHGTANTNASSPFVRHPTENLILAGAVTNIVNNPFAFDLDYATGTLTTVNLTGYNDTTKSKVMCLSCHRAHGTDQPDLLRFDYTLQYAGSTQSGGCLNCHLQQTN